MFNSLQIEGIIETALRDKLRNYNPESSHMPFHTRLLGKDRMALYSFLRSLNTTFRTSIYKRVAEGIAAGEFDEVASHNVIGRFSSGAQTEIARIMNGLTSASRRHNHADEIAQIRSKLETGEEVTKKLRKADIFLSRGNTRFLIDLKTVKPNISGFEKHKQDMLEWAASILHQDPSLDVRTIIAIPYNPYEPEPYSRWTLRGMLEIENQSQLMVGEEFWNFLAGGQDIYQDLLDCFENVGFRMRDDINDYFKELGARRYI